MRKIHLVLEPKKVSHFESLIDQKINFNSMTDNGKSMVYRQFENPYWHFP